MAVTPKNCLTNQWPTLILSFTADIISNTEKKKDIYAGQRGLSTARKNHDLVINDIEPITACAFF